MFKNKVTDDSIKCQNLKKHLLNLCILYGLNELQKDCRFCYESGFFQVGVDYASILAEAIKEVCRKIRPIAIPMIETDVMKDDML